MKKTVPWKNDWTRSTVILISIGLALIAVAASKDNLLDQPAKMVPTHPVHTDHSTFYKGAFSDGPSVTRACLECHKDSAKQIMKTAHWRWEGEEVVVPGYDNPMRIGKKNLINNFCIGVQSNWVKCTICHIGYGWEDEQFDFEKEENVDCLICHDRSGQYIKDSAGAGRPDKSVDLLLSAQSVGSPRRGNCGVCHFGGGGGDAVKHGDLDQSLLFPSSRVDVHMSKHKLDCIDCHRTKEHKIPGRSISVSVDNSNRVFCTDCHVERPHSDERLNAHTQSVTCQACHIPWVAREEATKVSWDWSQAGDLEREKAVNDIHKYLAIKGSFEYVANLVPDYQWYNWTSSRYLLGEKINPETPTVIAGPLGDITDPTAKIWPFKVHRGKQVYDTTYNYFLVPKTAGPDGYWKTFNWDQSLRLGSEKTGLAYSGSYGFAPTEMYWPLSHMVADKGLVLQCTDCHGDRGRISWEKLGYPVDPLLGGGRQKQGLLIEKESK